MMRSFQTRGWPRSAVRCVVAALASTAFAARVSAADPPRTAAIEVGAKGIKAVVLETGPGGPKTLLKADSNTTLAQDVAKTGAFAKDAIADTAEEAGKFAQRIRDEFHVPAARVAVYGSSGLPKASNRDDLVKAVADATSLAPMTFITPAEEVRYTIRGTIADPADRDRGLAVDVGSGNTKGGFLTPSGVVDFNVPFGSVTYENKVAAEAKARNEPFEAAAEQLRPTVLDPALSRQVDAHPELRDRGVVQLSGGAAYALTTLLKPETVRQPRVEITAGDIADYARLVRTRPIKEPSVDGITDPALQAAAKKEIRNVFDRFTPTNLVAGSEILNSLVSALRLENKTIRFDRDSLFACSRGKVLDMIEHEQAVPPPPVPPVPPPTPPAPLGGQARPQENGKAGVAKPVVPPAPPSQPAPPVPPGAAGRVVYPSPQSPTGR